jgi:tRNA(Ile)-lysidine synthase
VPAWPDVRLCVALSGGVDSVVLLAALCQSRSKKTRVRAVHVHHGLHPNADAWSEHCSALAKKLTVPLTTLRVKVAAERGESVEAAAREARYEALANTLDEGEVLLTAHHEDDQLETVLLQLMRGAGIAGLAAMPEVAQFGRGMLARPLLTRTRAELEAWATANELTWIEDDTNANEQFDRNYLRRQVLPLIRSRWPGASRAVARSARHAAEAKGLLDALARADVERASNGVALSVQRLRVLPPDRRRNAVRYWIARAGHQLPDATRLDEITRTLLDARPDANPFVEWNGVRVQRHADVIGLSVGFVKESGSSSAAALSNEGTVWDWRASPEIALAVPKGTLSLEPDPHGPLDASKLPETLTIRTRRGGERLRPKAGGRMKTLKSLLQESRIPLSERANLPLVFSGEQLLAVGARWLDASVQAAGSATPRRARLHWTR